MSKLNPQMTEEDIIIAMSAGNPGAINTCCLIINSGAKIDPDSALGGFGNLMDLDMLEIYGEKIYKLWDHVCNRDIVKVITVLRAYQLGQLAGVDAPAIYHAIDHHGAGLDLEAIVAAVKARLPNFRADYQAK